MQHNGEHNNQHTDLQPAPGLAYLVGMLSLVRLRGLGTAAGLAGVLKAEHIGNDIAGVSSAPEHSERPGPA